MSHIVEDQGQRITQVDVNLRHGLGQPVDLLGGFTVHGCPGCFPIAPAVAGFGIGGLFAPPVMGSVHRHLIQPRRNFRPPLIARQFSGQSGTDVLG